MKDYPNIVEIKGYLQSQLAKRLKWHNDWDQPNLFVNIGLGCPRYSVEVYIHSLTLDRQAAIILYDLGIPDALETSRSYQNFDNDYLSISGKSLEAFGRANKEKINMWADSRCLSKPVMQQLYEKAVRSGIGEKLDYLLNSAIPVPGGVA
jgi:hypothetical protein